MKNYAFWHFSEGTLRKVGIKLGTELIPNLLLKVFSLLRGSGKRCHRRSCATLAAKFSVCFAITFDVDMVTLVKTSCNCADGHVCGWQGGPEAGSQNCREAAHVLLCLQDAGKDGGRRTDMRIGKIRIGFTDDEIRIIVRSLVELRNELIREGKIISQAASNSFTTFIDHMIEEMTEKRPPFGQFALSTEKAIWTDFNLWNETDDTCSEIENYESKYYREGDLDEGEYYAGGIVGFLEEFLADNGISTRLRYQSVEEFVDNIHM